MGVMEYSIVSTNEFSHFYFKNYELLVVMPPSNLTNQYYHKHPVVKMVNEEAFLSILHLHSLDHMSHMGMCYDGQ